MIGNAIPDIPRLYTALAEWLSCLVIVLSLKPAISRYKVALLSLLYLGVLIAFLELTANIADGYYVEYILVGDQKLSVDQNGKLVLDQVYMDVQELTIQCVVRQSSDAATGQSGQKNTTVIWISIACVGVLAAVAGVFLLKKKAKRGR